MLSLSLFAVRGAWMVAGTLRDKGRWVRIVPHVIDTALLASAIGLAITIGQYPGTSGWLTAKVAGLVAYIVLGSFALKRGRPCACASRPLLARSRYSLISSASRLHDSRFRSLPYDHGFSGTIVMSAPLTPALAGFDEPIEMLKACHERIERQLSTLERLLPHLAANGCDGEARQAAANILRYFNEAGPHHHADEEQDLFPFLLAQRREDAERANVLVAALLGRPPGDGIGCGPSCGRRLRPLRPASHFAASGRVSWRSSARFTGAISLPRKPKR